MPLIKFHLAWMGYPKFKGQRKQRYILVSLQLLFLTRYLHQLKLRKKPSCVVEVENNHCLKQPPCLAHLARMGTADGAAGQVLRGVWSRDLLALHQDGDLTSSEVTDTPRSKRESYWQRPDGQVLFPLAGAEMNASWILHLS